MLHYNYIISCHQIKIRLHEIFENRLPHAHFVGTFHKYFYSWFCKQHAFWLVQVLDNVHTHQDKPRLALCRLVEQFQLFLLWMNGITLHLQFGSDTPFDLWYHQWRHDRASNNRPVQRSGHSQHGANTIFSRVY